MDTEIEYRVQVIQPKQDCPFCHGTGEVNDWVPAPFSSGNVPMPSLCGCVEEQTDDDTDEVLLDLDYNSPTDEIDSLEADDAAFYDANIAQWRMEQEF